MVILRRCCCWKNVKSGSFASGIYTLIFYIIVLTAGAFHIHTVVDTPTILMMSLVMLMCSGTCVISSVLLLIGLCVDSKALLLPWIVSVSATTMLDIFFSIYLVIEAYFKTFLMVLFAIDAFIGALNLYCLLCVISQYQMYCTEGGRQCQGYGRQEPTVQYQSSSSSGPRSLMNQSSDKLAPNGNGACEGYKLLTPPGTDSRFKPNSEISFISEDLSTTTTSLQDYHHRELMDIQDRQRSRQNSTEIDSVNIVTFGPNDGGAVTSRDRKDFIVTEK